MQLACFNLILDASDLVFYAVRFVGFSSVFSIAFLIILLQDVICDLFIDASDSLFSATDLLLYVFRETFTYLNYHSS